METKSDGELAERVVTLAQEAVEAKGFVNAIDVFLGLGWLSPENLDEWRRGKTGFLESLVLANLSKISRAMKGFHAWAAQADLEPRATEYRHKGKDLRFSKFAIPAIETAYRTNYLKRKPTP